MSPCGVERECPSGVVVAGELAAHTDGRFLALHGAPVFGGEPSGSSFRLRAALDALAKAGLSPIAGHANGAADGAPLRPRGRPAAHRRLPGGRRRRLPGERQRRCVMASPAPGRPDVVIHRDGRKYGTSSGKWTPDFVKFPKRLILAEAANRLAGVPVSPPKGVSPMDDTPSAQTSPTLLGRLRQQPTDKAAWEQFRPALRPTHPRLVPSGPAARTPTSRTSPRSCWSNWPTR